MNNDNIFWMRGGGSSSAEDSISRGALLIDPNKVVNEANQVVDRYVKQEDLTIYCSLIAYKNDQTSVYQDSGTLETKTSVTNNELIRVNFLNPVRRRTDNGDYVYKDKLTSEWADFFTSDSVANNTLDPETFGISNINMSINANHTPITTIEFIDVQGKTLFERGNDPSNPYNVFFTFPYPKFLLVFKGYYGTALEIPLVIKHTNTKFDPSNGNYIITVDFVSEIFNLFNSLLIIYAYVAPFMFKIDDNDEYLGRKILKLLYDRQNKKIKENFPENDSRYKDYEINNSPTLLDLATAIKTIPFDKFNTTNESGLINQNNNNLIVKKLKLEQFFGYITKFFNNQIEDNLYDIDGIKITPIKTDSKLTDNTPLKLLTSFSSINQELSDLDDNILNQIKTVIKTNINTNQNDVVSINKKYFNLLNDNKFFNNHLFINNKNIEEYTLKFFDIVCNVILTELLNKQNEVQDTYIESQIENIGEHLGWRPNLNNVLRIISNNIQTFLMLLEITSVSAQNQIADISSQRMYNTGNSVEYDIDISNKFKKYKPFPNFYKRLTVNGESINELHYPGIKLNNRHWFEVAFIEEIYEAIQVLFKKLKRTDDETQNKRFTSILTTMGLGDTNLLVYDEKNNDHLNIMAEAILKFNLYISNSGTYNRNLGNDTLSKIGQEIANHEIELIDSLIMNELPTEVRFVLSNNIKDLTTDGLNGFINKINGGSVFDSILSGVIDDIRSVKTPITESQHNNIHTRKNSIISNNLDTYNNFYNTINYKNSMYNFTLNNNNLFGTNKKDVYIDITKNRDFFSRRSISINTAMLEKNKGSGHNYLSGFIGDLNTKLKNNTRFNGHFSNTFDYDYPGRSKSYFYLTFNDDGVYDGSENKNKSHIYNNL